MDFARGVPRLDLLVGLARKVVLFPGLMLIAALTAHGQMRIPGELAVNQTGAATYTIPIQVPPGIAGIEPKLAIAYNSQVGSGSLGPGWTLTGLSAITRCPQTKAQDGNEWVGGVNYTATDRYCLDGQRLVNVPDPASLVKVREGVYGAPDTYYSTERESFSRVQSFGQMGTAPYAGPSYFIVKTKNGLTMEYGASTQSKVMATNGKTSMGVVRVWALNRVLDAVGNYMDFSYTEPDVSTGQYYISRIDYTGNLQASPAALPKMSVFFDYAGRPEAVVAYEAGGMVKSTYRLSKIRTSAGATPIQEYTIAYTDTTPQAPHSLVEGVSQCTPDGTCLPATGFQYQPIATSFQATALGTGGGKGYWTSYMDGNTQPFHLLGDFNGDGKTDFMYANGAGWTVMTNGPSGWIGHDWGKGTGPGFWPGDTGISSQSFQFPGDFNGDGKTDYMYWDNAGWRVLLSTGTGWRDEFWGKGSGRGYWADYAFSMGSSQAFQFTGDFNGDGKTDFMYSEAAGWRVLLSTGAGWIDQLWGKGAGPGYYNLHPLPDIQPLHFVNDFNGDGKTDFMYWDRAAAGWRVLLSTGSGWTDQFWGKGSSTGMWNGYNKSPQSYQVFQFSGDFNGDKKADLMYWDAQWRVLLSTGTGWVDQLWGKGSGPGYMPSYSSFSSQAFHFAADFTGDGKTDFMYWDGSGWRLLVSKGGGWDEQILGTAGGTGYWSAHNTRARESFQMVADFNGDGKSDFMHWDAAQSEWRLLSVPGHKLLSSVVEGLKQATNVSHGTPAELLGSPSYSMSFTPKLPQVAIAPVWSVVTDVSRPDGRGGFHRTNYSYDTAVTEVGTGRGFVGFNYLQTEDTFTGLVGRTYWRHDFPFAGMADRMTNGTSAATPDNLGQVATLYSFDNFRDGCSLAPGMRYFVYPIEIKSSNNFDLTEGGAQGAPLPGKRTTNMMDKWGNLTSTLVRLTNPDGTPSWDSTYTRNNYGNDLSKWYLGRLLTSSTEFRSIDAYDTIQSIPSGCYSAFSGTGGDGAGGRMPYQRLP